MVSISRSAQQGALRKTILIVEHNDLNMKLFHDLLETRGYNVLQAGDGMEGLRLARQHRPDLIIVDIQLPGICGLEVARWMKEDDALRAIPVIAVTAFAMKDDKEKMRAAGCDAYIVEPMSTSNFLKTIEGFLAGTTRKSPALAGGS